MQMVSHLIFLFNCLKLKGVFEFFNCPWSRIKLFELWCAFGCHVEWLSYNSHFFKSNNNRIIWLMSLPLQWTPTCSNRVTLTPFIKGDSITFAFLIPKWSTTHPGIYSTKAFFIFLSLIITLGVQKGAFIKSSEYCTTILNCIWPGLSSWVDYNNPVSMVASTHFYHFYL